MEDVEAQNLQGQIDQLRSMIPLMSPGHEDDGGNEGAEYICGDDSQIVFSPVDGTNQIKVDVYYV